MAIALACEILKKVSKARKKLENHANRAMKDLLELGKMFSSKVEDEGDYEQMIFMSDFKQRSLLKIITDNGFEPLMSRYDPKAENIMNSIFHGKESTRCDGDLKGYSSLTHIAWTPSKKHANSINCLSFFLNQFTPNFSVDYAFQYRY